MDRFLWRFAAGLTLWLVCFTTVSGAEFKLANGSTLTGEPASMNDDGLVVRLEIGGFSERVAWGQLTQETLKALKPDPRATDYVDPFIEIPASERIKRKEIRIQPVPRVERPEGRIRLLAAFATPGGLLLLLTLYAANIYVGYEVARFRSRPSALVCGSAAILPIVGPIIFLSMPPSYATGSAAHPDHLFEETAPEPINPMQAAGAPKGAGGLSVAGGKKDAGPAVDTQLYSRGDTTFNRRFFETKFAGFFRVVPTDAEKDFVLVIKSAKGEYVARRISRIGMNDMHLQLLNRGTAEVAIGFGEVIQVHARHKDAKG